MKMLKIKNMFKFLQKKVPLWGLLLAGIIIIAESAQIMTETRLRSEHRKYWIEKVRFCSNAIYQNLEYILENEDDEEKITPSLIGAYLYSDQLDDVQYFVLQKTSYADGKTYTGYEAQKVFIFEYVHTTLEQILNEYKETYSLSESDYKTIQLFCEEFHSLSETIKENPQMSKEQFEDCISTLYTSIYLK